MIPLSSKTEEKETYEEPASEESRAAQALEVYKCNWKEAVGVFIATAVQMSFFPGVMLSPDFQWGFISDYSWFVITLVTYASLSDTIGRWVAGRADLVSKKNYLLSNIVRGIIFTIIYLLTFFDVSENFLGSTWFIMVGLLVFATTYGYFITLGFKYGSDETTGDQGMAGTIVGFHMTFGICFGSAIALAFLS